MSPKIVLIPLASLAVIGTAALLHERTSPAPAPICVQHRLEDRLIEPMVEVPSIPTRRFARPPAPPAPPPAAPHMVPVA